MAGFASLRYRGGTTFKTQTVTVSNTVAAPLASFIKSCSFARNRSYTVTLTATGAGGSATATQPVTCTKSCS